MSEAPLNRRFIVLEGGEGSGKSTLAAALGARFAAEGREVVLTREPGGTTAGELVRKLLHEPLTPWAEAFAFFVARAQLMSEVIRPALERGATVVCDRFAASTYAYQGYARELRAANAVATGDLEPGLTIFLDLDVEVGLTRKHGEDEAIRTGLESVEFHRRVRRGYLSQMVEAAPGTWVRIDAALPPGEVAAAAWAAIAPR
jgi:dTMP kinase